MKISDLLREDHARVERLIVELDTWDADELQRGFNTFRKALQRHMFVEELAVFTFIRTEHHVELSCMPTLQQQHDEILLLLDQMDETRHQSPPMDVAPLKHALLAALDEHRRFEDEELYPRFDADLGEQQKRTILLRLQACID